MKNINKKLWKTKWKEDREECHRTRIEMLYNIYYYTEWYLLFAGMKGLLNRKLYWYPKFYRYVLFFVDLKLFGHKKSELD